MTISNTLIDNSSEQLKLVNSIKKCIINTHCKSIKIATGYWDIPGMALIYQELKDFLYKEKTVLQLLIGSDPTVRISQLKNPIHKDAKFPQDYIKRDIQTLEVTDRYVDVVRLLQAFCKDNENESNFQIRIYQYNEEGDVQFLHAKCFVFSGNGYSTGIIGSSNFTQKGLEGNSELNYLETNSMIVAAKPSEVSYSKGHIAWFDEKWALSTPWNRTFLEEILKDAPITKKAEEPLADLPITPYELYIKLLQYKFGDLINKNFGEQIESYLPSRFDSLDYQIDAVKQCFNTMKEHGGFLLADVVGLGKTIVGTLVVKHFLSVPDDDGRDRKVLIITPPAIQSAWTETISKFDEGSNEKMIDAIDFITTGSIGKLVDEFDEDIDDNIDTGEFLSDITQKNYGLIIIDESHKFRNSNTSMYASLDNVIAQIGAETGMYPYIGLLSATPQNNMPDDLKNQIYLFERNHADSTLKKAMGGNLEGFFADINRQYSQLIHPGKNIADSESFMPISKEKRNAALIEIAHTIRDSVLSDILIRRTRTDVIRYYQQDLDKQNIIFPQISGPHSLDYEMEPELAQLFARSMDLIAPNGDFMFDNSDYLCYYRYRAIEFFVDKKIKDLYKGGNLDPDHFSRQLAKIMQINLVKRIESSFSAFKSSLRNLKRYTQNMIDMWERNVIFICPQIDVNKELNPRKHWDKNHKLLSFDECANDIRKKIKRLNESGKNDNQRNREYTRDAFSTDYIDKLRKDFLLINNLCDEWAAYESDPKLEKFKDELRPTLFNKERNSVQKLVIFSEAIDTVNTLEKAVKLKGYKPLVITAKNRKEKERTIKENFDANYDGEHKDDYQVIITTEVLAEGINLHRANCILNYDTPWNSTRLMQRIGRINRIGSTAPYVYVYNFMPSAQGDSEIQLVNKAHIKLQSFHTLFGEDSQIFSENEEVSNYDLNMQVNGDESPMEKYVYELKKYKESNPARYDFLETQNENLELAADGAVGNGLFLVRTPNMSGMFIKVDNNGSRIISAIDMYNWFKTNHQIGVVELPADWTEMKKKAELAVNRQLSRMNTKVRNSNRATQAKAILTHMNANQLMSQESKNLLADAFSLINKGNSDIIRKIISIDEHMHNGQQEMFAYTQEDFDNMIKLEIENMVANVRSRYGKAQVFIGLYK